MIKDWLYKKFFNDRHSKSYNEGCEFGYSQGREMQMLEDNLQSIEMVKSWLVDPDKVFTVTKSGLIMLHGQQITSKELNNLKAEVRTFKSFQIYEIIMNSVRKLALEKAVLTATDLYSPKGNEQVLAGKMMVWDLDIIETILKRIDKAKIT